MLAFLIESVSGMSFEDYLDENIFTPLGMSDTVFDDGMEILQNKAYGYCMNYKSIVRGEYHNPMYSIGAGGVVSTSADLYKWYLCLKNRKLMGNAVYDRFFKENLNAYCCGLFKDSLYGRIRYQHDGAHELDEELARKYEGVYIKDRVELRRVNDQWEFVHLNRFHKPIYPTGNHQFHSTWLDHSYTLVECEDGGI
jgi:hypothetical protein